MADDVKRAMIIADKAWRHEFKYLCTEGQLAMLYPRLDSVMSIDMHAGGNGKYEVKSMYFDDIEDRCFSENENGTDVREKYRIRVYNNSKKRISLERKRKECDKTLKESCLLTEDQFDLLAYGKGRIAEEKLPLLAKQLLVLERTSLMCPKITVSYERIPYVYKNGNVRVTIDRGIASSSQVDRFWDDDCARRQILPMGWQLLEVKYDSYLPDPIYHALSLENMQRITFSKYYLCRKFFV